MKKIFNEYSLALLSFVAAIIGICIFFNLLSSEGFKELISKGLYLK